MAASSASGYVQQFRRGILHSVVVAAHRFLERGEILFGGPFPIRRVGLHQTWDDMPARIPLPVVPVSAAGCDE
jgi:hypothetical protein